jgi:hypothetical protein
MTRVLPLSPVLRRPLRIGGHDAIEGGVIEALARKRGQDETLLGVEAIQGALRCAALGRGHTAES